MDAPWVQPSSAGIFQPQAGDLTVTIDDHTPDSGTGLEGQRDIYHGVAARLAGHRGSHALEPASGLGHGSPPACDPVRIHAHARVEFVACLLPAAPDEIAEQRLCPVLWIGRNVLCHRPCSCTCWLAAVSVRSVAEWVTCTRFQPGYRRGALAAINAVAAAWPMASTEDGPRRTWSSVRSSHLDLRARVMRPGVRRAGLPRQSPALTPGQRRREAPP
jgi:hypothetical protein